MKSFVHKNGTTTTRVRDPESLGVEFANGSAWTDAEKNSHAMVPVHTLGINIDVQRNVQISDEGSDKDVDDKELAKIQHGRSNVHF